MKRTIGLFACLMFLATFVHAETLTNNSVIQTRNLNLTDLTNESVIQLHKLGLADSAIVAKIKASTCYFDMSPDGLKTLRDAGITDEVLQAMTLVVTSAATTTAAAASFGNPNDPKTPHAYGMYLYQTVNGKPKMTLMAPARIEDVTAGGGWDMAFGATSKTAVIAGAHAELQIKDSEPIFYFYFPKADDGLGSIDVSAILPDDYAIGVLEARVTHDQSVRAIKISQASTGGYQLHPFTSEKISDGVYKVTPIPLMPGEYVFVQMAGTRIMTALKSYDFGIQAAPAAK